MEQSIDTLPPELVEQVLVYLTPPEFGMLTRVAKHFYAFTDRYWGLFLKIKPPPMIKSMTLFQSSPELRTQHIDIDIKGTNYLIDCRSASPDLTITQASHLTSKRVREQIWAKEITIEAAIQRTSDKRVRVLQSPFAYAAINCGFTVEEVQQSWFSAKHLDALNEGKFTYEEVAGLQSFQVQGMLNGLSREQVCHLHFSEAHCTAIQSSIYQFDEISMYIEHQVQGLLFGLRPEIALGAWFTSEHMQALSNNLHHIHRKRSSIKRFQIEALARGVAPFHVFNQRFTPQHTQLLTKYPYHSIRNIPHERLLGLLLGFTVKQVTDKLCASLLEVTIKYGTRNFSIYTKHASLSMHLTDHNNENALHYAAKYNRSRLAQYFILKDININKKNTLGNTPLHLAAIHNHSKVLRILLDFSANLHVTNLSGHKPVDEAKGEAKEELLIEHFIEKRINGPEHKRSFTLFNHTFRYGPSTSEELKASLAYRCYLRKQLPASALSQHKAVLPKGELGTLTKSHFRKTS